MFVLQHHDMYSLDSAACQLLNYEELSDRRYRDKPAKVYSNPFRHDRSDQLLILHKLVCFVLIYTLWLFLTSSSPDICDGNYYS